MDEKFRDYAILKVKSKATINPMNKGKDTDKHRRYVEILKERQVEVRKIKTFFAPPSKMPKDLIREDDALQYFIGVGEIVPDLLEALKNLISFHQSPGIITDKPEKKAVELTEQAIAKTEAILTSLTGEVINAKQD